MADSCSARNLPERTDGLRHWITCTQVKIHLTTAIRCKLSKQINLKKPQKLDWREIIHYSHGKIISLLKHVCCVSYREWHILESGGNIRVFKHRQPITVQKSTWGSLRMSPWAQRAQEEQQLAEVTGMTKMEEHNSFQIQKCLMALKCYFNGDHMLTFKHNSTALLNMVVFNFSLYFTFFYPTLSKTIK